MDTLKNCTILILAFSILATLQGCTETSKTASNGTASTREEANFPGVIGWEADKDGVIAFSDGSFYVRDGKDTTFGFGIFNHPDHLSWYNNEGYLPCLVTEFKRDNATVRIMNFADKVTLGGSDYVVVYSRVMVINNTSSSLELTPMPSAGLVALTSGPTTISPGQTSINDYAVAADRFGNSYAWPTDTALAAAGGWDTHYAHMKDYWNSRLSEIVNITQLPDPRLINAYKAGFIYTHIIRDGNDIHVGENGYDQVFDHDSLGILTTLFSLGDFSHAKDLLNALQAQTQYDDARYKNSWVWALYLLKTGDKDYVASNFAAIKANTHQIETDRTGPDGVMKTTNDIDANGTWLVDDTSALFGLTTYTFLANQLGDVNEEAWAKSLYTSLLDSVNGKLSQTMNQAGIDYLPCSLAEPNTSNRCRDPQDANWASMLLFGRWFWEGYLWGAVQRGPLLDSLDATYSYGFGRLEGILPAHTYGGYPGYSTTYNAGYGHSGLRGTQYRTEAILDYQFMLDTTQSSPYGWWENIEPPAQTAWDGTHPANGGGACPHMWGQSFATAGLLDSLIVEKSDGSLLIGRGVPSDWIMEGQVIELTNYPVSINQRIGIRIEGLSGSQVRLTLTGDAAGTKVVVFNLPAFIDHIASATTGIIDNAAGTVTLELGEISVTVTLQ